MTNAPSIEMIKARIKATWESGDYGVFAKYLEPGAFEILAGWRIAPGSRMLDVACGAGQITIPAARAGIQVTGVDIAENLIAQARSRAAAEGVAVQFEQGDAEQLPYPDASFDVVVSLIGAMFAPRPERVAAELIRVCRPGGRILMGNWTPNGHVGQMFKAIGKHVPPPPGVPSPLLWGDEAIVRERLREGISDLKMERRFYPSFAYPFTVPEVVQFFRLYYGPIERAFAQLDAASQEALRWDLEEVFSANNRGTDGTTAIQAEYLDVSAVRG
jgi:ubiquinone/menaquinone biosynthesis C-methylase UbiE